MKKLFSVLILIFILQSGQAFSLESEDIGISFKPGKYDAKRIFLSIKGKEREIKMKGEVFVDPKGFKKSKDGNQIIFLDAVEYNEFDSVVYLYDIKKDKTIVMMLRNIHPKFVRQLEWFDTHSFLIDIFSENRLNFTVGRFGPIYNGKYLVRFDDDFNAEMMVKIEW